MSEPIDFYFDFSSPYAFLLSERIDDVASAYGRTVRWHPILLGAIFKTTGSAPLTAQAPAKATYSLRDFSRSARFMGLIYRHPSHFPQATQNAARAFYWLHDRDGALARRYAHATFQALFVADRDISAPDTVLDIAETLGVERGTLAAALHSPEMKARLRAECDRALDLGVFGAPYVLIDGEPFFGADRLPQIERWLATGGF